MIIHWSVSDMCALISCRYTAHEASAQEERKDALPEANPSPRQQAPLIVSFIDHSTSGLHTYVNFEIYTYRSSKASI